MDKHETHAQIIGVFTIQCDYKDTGLENLEFPDDLQLKYEGVSRISKYVLIQDHSERRFKAQICLKDGVKLSGNDISVKINRKDEKTGIVEYIQAH